MGTLVGGRAVSIGRRKAGIYWQLLAVVGAGITMVPNAIMFCVGRFLAGITSGIAGNVMGKSIDETIPAEVQGQFGILTNLYIVGGLPLSYSMGALLPTDKELMADDQNWRVIFAMPAVIAIVHVALFLFVFKQEPVAYCVSEGREAEAKAFLRRIYKSGDEAADDFEMMIDEQFIYLSNNTAKDASVASFRDAVCGTKYRKATWVCALLNTFMQQTGINAVNVYASRLLVSMDEATGGNFPVSPLVGANIMGFVNIFGAALVILPVTFMGRKPIFVIGQGTMSLCLFFCGLASSKNTTSLSSYYSTYTSFCSKCRMVA